MTRSKFLSSLLTASLVGVLAGTLGCGDPEAELPPPQILRPPPPPVPPQCPFVKDGEDIRVTQDEEPSFHPWITPAGNGFGLAWGSGKDREHVIRFQRLDLAGRPVGQPVTAVADPTRDAMQPVLASSGSGFAIAIPKYKRISELVTLTRLDATGRVQGKPSVIYKPRLRSGDHYIAHGNEYRIRKYWQ